MGSHRSSVVSKIDAKNTTVSDTSYIGGPLVHGGGQTGRKVNCFLTHPLIWTEGYQGGALRWVCPNKSAL